MARVVSILFIRRYDVDRADATLHAISSSVDVRRRNGSIVYWLYCHLCSQLVPGTYTNAK